MSLEVTLESILALGKATRKKIVASASPENALAGLASEELLALMKPSKRPCKVTRPLRTRHRRVLPCVSRVGCCQR